MPTLVLLFHSQRSWDWTTQPDCSICGFSQPLHVEIVPRIKPWLLPSKFFPIHYFLITTQCYRVFMKYAAPLSGVFYPHEQLKKYV